MKFLSRLATTVIAATLSIATPTLAADWPSQQPGHFTMMRGEIVIPDANTIPTRFVAVVLEESG